ncbi:MAG: transposase [Thermomicrobiales bacterium]|nr:transposase [Thermomicrobiales bacterium]
MEGVSTRRIDDPVKALGVTGGSESQVSCVCAALDAEVERVRSRPPRVLPVAGCHVTQGARRSSGRRPGGGRGDRSDGKRRPRGRGRSYRIGPSEDGTVWLALLRGRVARGQHVVGPLSQPGDGAAAVRDAARQTAQRVARGRLLRRCRVGGLAAGCPVTAAGGGLSAWAGPRRQPRLWHAWRDANHPSVETLAALVSARQHRAGAHHRHDHHHLDPDWACSSVMVLHRSTRQDAARLNVRSIQSPVYRSIVIESRL